MGDFKYLSEDELTNLSSKERREYLRNKREYENSKLVSDTLNFSETKESEEPVNPETNNQMSNELVRVNSENIESPKTEDKKTYENKPLEKRENVLANEIPLPVGKKKLKTHHKNFLMTEKRYMQFKNLANERGQSENALFNDILTQIFGEE